MIYRWVVRILKDGSRAKSLLGFVNRFVNSRIIDNDTCGVTVRNGANSVTLVLNTGL